MSEAKNEIPTDYVDFVCWILTAPYRANDNERRNEDVIY